MDCNICISSCACLQDGGGLYVYKLSEKGELSKSDYYAADRPMYAVYDERKIYVALRQVFCDNSGIFSIGLSDGVFTQASTPISTMGIVACHLAVNKGNVYATNYLSGSVVKLPDKLVTFTGHGINPVRQEASHTHCVILSPDAKYLLVTDLGTDKIYVMTHELEIVSQASVQSGHGARHIVFSPNGRYLYCVNEMAATVSVFEWNADKAELVGLCTFDSGVAPEILPVNGAAAIRVSKDGSKLYISNRGEDTIVVFHTRDGVNFDLVQKVSSNGNHPRDFQITPDERFMICANMECDSVVVFPLKDGFIGEAVQKIFVPKPLCVTNLNMC